MIVWVDSVHQFLHGHVMMWVDIVHWTRRHGRSRKKAVTLAVTLATAFRIL